MKNFARTGATAVLTAPLLAAVFAAPASADPSDVTLSTSVDGNDVTVSIVNNTQFQLTCNWTAASETSPQNQYTDGGLVGENGKVFDAQTVADGSYLVNWVCDKMFAPEEQWGTPDFADSPTTEPEEFTVGQQHGGSGSLADLLKRLFS
ncbi:hypothetical protein BFN03_04165 [Rhodococcus sp. WMMA185]|uniref:hypothetical protein n=1 Tax=Rhodococcus sp. WMMA185 TaxID=679318 RepID=UPI000878ADEB|nr:hypothetical protein [Rhodococcus sp. WMMA185]AOW92174.1 hypothetical protein BFN03_04165 [Rhodococcus sp. WMMA185]